MWWGVLKDGFQLCSRRSVDVSKALFRPHADNDPGSLLKGAPAAARVVASPYVKQLPSFLVVQVVDVKVLKRVSHILAALAGMKFLSYSTHGE